MRYSPPPPSRYRPPASGSPPTWGFGARVPLVSRYSKGAITLLSCCAETYFAGPRLPELEGVRFAVQVHVEKEFVGRFLAAGIVARQEGIEGDTSSGRYDVK